MSEIPKEAGEWWAWRLKGDDHKMVQIGMSRESTNSFASGLVIESNNFIVNQDHFEEYHWHKIELPEGWR